MQIGIVAKKIGLSVDAIRFYERNSVLPRPRRTEGDSRRYRGKRRRDAGLCPPRAGPGIQTERDSWAFAAARESLAALRAGAASPSRKASRRTAET